MTAAPSADVVSATRTLCVGAVSYLNTKPLIWGLEDAPGVNLRLDVPARLLEGLQDGRYDIAMLPIIDYQRMDGLRLVPSAGIGSDGQTLTVRIFSPVPIEQIGVLACDTHSHTSVALARVILARHYGIRPRFTELAAEVGDPQRPAKPEAAIARLLIGDKVVQQDGAGYPHQLDLGEAWKAMTGLPFVFAAWMARPGVDLGSLPAELETAKHQGLANVDRIVERHAANLGWPADLARRYLIENMQYDIGPRQIEAIRLFHRLAAEEGVVPAPARELVIAQAL